ncbi:MAG: hypothetical protein ABSA83_14270 [Verrucomicrobiota bacterium]
MKTARFFFIIIGFGAWTLGVGHAGEPSSQSSEKLLPGNHAKSFGVKSASQLHAGTPPMQDSRPLAPRAQGEESRKWASSPRPAPPQALGGEGESRSLRNNHARPAGALTPLNGAAIKRKP